MRIPFIPRGLARNDPALAGALWIALVLLVLFSPSEATLGDAVKIVYLHGAAERISMVAFWSGAALGLYQLLRPDAWNERWTRALLETALVGWLAQFVISLPAQFLAWGGFSWNEPRVSGALWILVLGSLYYAAARRLQDPSWMALAACAGAATTLIVLKGAANILHPLNPIAASESASIKIFYAAITWVIGGLAVLYARRRAHRFLPG